MEKYLFSNEKKISPIWRHLTLQKNYLPKSHQQNRPNPAKMLAKLCLKNDGVTYCLVEKKTDKVKLWRSICLVMKKKNFSPIWRRLTLQKNYLPKSHQQNQPNAAKMLTKICVKKEDVKKCPVEKKLVKQSCGEVSG